MVKPLLCWLVWNKWRTPYAEKVPIPIHSCVLRRPSVFLTATRRGGYWHWGSCAGSQCVATTSLSPSTIWPVSTGPCILAWLEKIRQVISMLRCRPETMPYKWMQLRRLLCWRRCMFPYVLELMAAVVNRLVPSIELSMRLASVAFKPLGWSKTWEDYTLGKVIIMWLYMVADRTENNIGETSAKRLLNLGYAGGDRQMSLSFKRDILSTYNWTKKGERMRQKQCLSWSHRVHSLCRTWVCANILNPELGLNIGASSNSLRELKM